MTMKMRLKKNLQTTKLFVNNSHRQVKNQIKVKLYQVCKFENNKRNDKHFNNRA